MSAESGEALTFQGEVQGFVTRWKLWGKPIRAIALLRSARASRGRTSGMGVNRIDLVFQHRPVSPPELDRHVVEPAGCRGAKEMTQLLYGDSGDLDYDFRMLHENAQEFRSRRPG